MVKHSVVRLLWKLASAFKCRVQDCSSRFPQWSWMNLDFLDGFVSQVGSIFNDDIPNMSREGKMGMGGNV